MTCAGFADCLLPYSKYSKSLFALVISITDVALTSSIALCFFFCAIIDLNFVKMSKYLALMLYFIGVTTLFVLWTVYYLEPKKFPGLNVYLYDGVVAVGCGTWVLT